MERLATASTGAKTIADLIDVAGEKFDRTLGLGGPLLHYNRKFGDAIENNSKIAHFIAKRESGLSNTEAAKSVRKYLFDYGDLTDFERKTMRTILPFYTWMRKNMPLQVQAMFEDPGRYAKIPKFFLNLESVSSDWHEIHTPD